LLQTLGLKIEMIMNTKHFFNKGLCPDKRLLSRTGRLLLLFLAMLLPTLVEAGWLIVEINRNNFGSLSMQSTFIQQNMVRIETNESVIILNLEKEELTLIFPDKKVFWTGKPADFREGMIASAEVQITSLIEQMPEGERDKNRKEFDEMIRIMRSDTLKPVLPGLVRIDQTSRQDTIAGQLARCFNIYIDSTLYEKVWISRDVNPFAEIDLDRMLAMSRELTQPSIVSAYRESPEYLSLIRKGFVLRSVMPTPIGESTTQVESIRKTDIRMELFMPPTDYRPVGLTEVLQMTMNDFDGIKQEPAPELRPGTLPGFTPEPAPVSKPRGYELK